MKTLGVLVLLSSAMLLCRTAPPLEPVTCGDNNGAAAARLAVHDINEHHDHGYKFRLSEIVGNNIEKVDDGCTIELQLNLLETVCHTVHPKHFEDCALRDESQSAVMANCTVSMTVKSGNANVTKYDCDTRKVKTHEEMMMFCPDCPTMIPLNSPDGFPVREAVKQVNSNTTNERYYVLKEVGRITAGHHAFCRSSHRRGKGLLSVECEYYPPSNETALGPGEREPRCNSHPVLLPRPPGHPRRAGHPHHAGHHGRAGNPHHDGHPHSTGHPRPTGHPLHDGHPHPTGHPHHDGHPRPTGHPHHDGHPRPTGHPHHDGHPHHNGHPHHDGSGGHHAHGQPDQGVFLHPFRPCHGLLPGSDPALHPICPMP
uniref:Histidine-rich glycoprotein-like n=1 Tax=Scophthalmus maximus TaxID=52904 RepID=A0A8D3DM28_SCOMX